jgi:hypothetical protein
MLNAECTTAVVGADKSNYWTPTLYYIHDNGTFEAMTPFNTRIYYFTRNETDMNPFPPGLRMVSGTAMSRDTSDMRMRGVELHCGNGAPDVFTPWLPNGTSHPNGCNDLHVGLRFPSCGLASGALDSENHFDHMSWPIESLDYGPEGPVYNPNGPLCPPSHPIKYPTMFVQAFYKFDPKYGRPWRAGKNNVVFSNGDMLGPSFHGDFVNGWDPTVLSNFVKQCNTPNGAQDKPQNCPAWAPTVDNDGSRARTCAYQGMLPAEDIGLYRSIPELPGCNPLWPADGPVNRQRCSKPSPGFAPPNRFLGIGNERRIPIYLPDAGNFTDMMLNEEFPAWGGQWGGENNQAGTAGGITYGNTYGAGATVQVSSDEDVANHVTFPIDTVAGMNDKSVFRVDFPNKASSAPAADAPAAPAANASAAPDSASPAASAPATGNVDTNATNGVAQLPDAELPGVHNLVADNPEDMSGTGAAAAAPAASSAAAEAPAAGVHYGGTRVYSAGSNGGQHGSGASTKKCNRKRSRSRARL